MERDDVLVSKNGHLTAPSRRRCTRHVTQAMSLCDGERLVRVDVTGGNERHHRNLEVVLKNVLCPMDMEFLDWRGNPRPELAVVRAIR